MPLVWGISADFWVQHEIANCELQKKIAHAHVRAHSHVCNVRANIVFYVGAMCVRAALFRVCNRTFAHFCTILHTFCDILKTFQGG